MTGESSGLGRVRRGRATGPQTLETHRADAGGSSLINTSQQIDAWQVYFSPHVKDENWLGLLTNMYSIGSIVSFFGT
jgi:hypothetical protein